METLARSAPDGYTIAMGHTGTQAINPHIYAKLTLRSAQGLRCRYAGGLIRERARGEPGRSGENRCRAHRLRAANPEKVTLGSGGTGATNHLSMELLKSLTGAPIVHVPYKGSAPALVDVMAGNITGMFDILVTSLPQIRNGKIRPLAVTSDKRSEYAPDIPTMRESGVPGYSEAGSDLWFGVFAPAGTPKPIVDRLNRELIKALDTAEVRERIRAQASGR